MTAPTSPYCTPELAGVLSTNLFRGRVPDANSPVPPETIRQLITWTDSMLEGDFHAVGYRIPFLEISGETWPTFQTTLLQFMSAIGAMAMATGYILAPAPQLTAGRAYAERNAYAIMVESFRQDVRKHGFRWRAQYYPGTVAERNIATKYGPATDFLVDKWDPTRNELFRAYTERMSEVFEDVLACQPDWDYFYSRREGV